MFTNFFSLFLDLPSGIMFPPPPPAVYLLEISHESTLFFSQILLIENA